MQSFAQRSLCSNGAKRIVQSGTAKSFGIERLRIESLVHIMVTTDFASSHTMIVRTLTPVNPV